MEAKKLSIEELKNIAQEISEENSKLKSLSVRVSPSLPGGDGCLHFDCVRYRSCKVENHISKAQQEYVEELCRYQSRSNLMKINKWCASAIISAVKKYEIPRLQTYVSC